MRGATGLRFGSRAKIFPLKLPQFLPARRNWEIFMIFLIRLAKSIAMWYSKIDSEIVSEF